MSTAMVKADVKGVAEQVQEIQHLMAEVMKDGEHYGTIPGCGEKKTLLKSGAEKLGLLFHIAPEYKIEKTELPDGHREYMIVCRLTNRSTGEFLGEGVGICTTMEKKYRYRSSSRKCPACGEPKIIPGKKEYGGGWVCWSKDGTGCKAKFAIDAPEITEQKTGKIDNPDIADTYNTVMKVGKKRALVDATLTATAASDIFTQDLEDIAVEPAQVIEAEIVEEPKGEPVILNEAENKQLTSMILDLIKWFKDKDFLDTLPVEKRRNYQKVLSDSEGKSVIDNDKVSIANLPGILHVGSVRMWHEGISKAYDTYDLTKGATDGK